MSSILNFKKKLLLELLEVEGREAVSEALTTGGPWFHKAAGWRGRSGAADIAKVADNTAVVARTST